MTASLGERYVVLGLRLGRLVDGLVDGYFGPPELQAAAESGEAAQAMELRAEAVALRAEVADATLDPQQRRWLVGQLEGLTCTAELAAGEHVSWVEAVRRCYGIEFEPTPEEEFDRIHHRLDAVLPAAVRSRTGSSAGTSRSTFRPLASSTGTRPSATSCARARASSSTCPQTRGSRPSS